MLVDDEIGSPTMHLALAADDLPLLDGGADLVICRNALDHMRDPGLAVPEMSGILRNDGALFISVDIGGAPTPDEPSVFPVESLGDLFPQHFEVVTHAEGYPPHSGGRLGSVRVVAKSKRRASNLLDKAKILQAYEARLR